MAMERVPGSPLLERLDRLGPRQAARLAGRLGGLVAELAAVPADDVAHLVPIDVASPDLLLAEARETASRPELLDLVPASSRAGLEAFLAGDPGVDQARVPVLVHGDLGAEHVFVDDEGSITGVIDWSDAVLGDPALDLGLVLRDLGPDAGEVAVARYVARAPDGADIAGVLPRARFLARVRALEDLAYGVDEDAPLYRDNALRAIRRLF
jgi:aminoglycoside phosphotransferase (APT) family kinase protein